MTPNIRPFLEKAIAAHPQRWAENTYDSCRFILQLTLKLAGMDWQYVGKTADADGPSVQPPGFLPFNVALTRPDGQQQTVRIVGVSHDAAWHVPSGRQVKVIVNSAANSDSRPEIHGPARIGGEIITQSNYRWHNPPVPQIFEGTGTQTTPQSPVASPVFVVDRGEFKDEGAFLHRFYKDPEGLHREHGLWIDDHPDWEGIGAWLFDAYLTARVAGKTREAARALYVAQIRDSGEWKLKHPNG